jgi:hypothetical protein
MKNFDQRLEVRAVTELTLAEAATTAAMLLIGQEHALSARVRAAAVSLRALKESLTEAIACANASERQGECGAGSP